MKSATRKPKIDKYISNLVLHPPNPHQSLPSGLHSYLDYPTTPIHPPLVPHPTQSHLAIPIWSLIWLPPIWPSIWMRWGYPTHVRFKCHFAWFESLCVDWSHLVCCPPWENNIFRLVWKTSQNSREATHLQRNIARLVTFVGWWVNLKNIGSGRDFFKVSYFSDTVTIYVKCHTGSKLNLQETKHFR